MNQGKWLLESFDLNSIKEAANTRNTKPTVRLGCSFHELSGPTLFLFPLTRPCFTGMGRSVDFFLTSQIGYPLNLIVYSKTCLKRPLKKNTKICLFFQDRLSHMAGQKYCRMLGIYRPFVLTTFVVYIFEWPF